MLKEYRRISEMQCIIWE